MNYRNRAWGIVGERSNFFLLVVACMILPEIPEIATKFESIMIVSLAHARTVTVEDEVDNE